MNNVELIMINMKKYSIYIIFFFFTLYSCRDMTEYNQITIVGEWIPIDKENMDSYIFEENEICRKETGFYDYVDSTKATVSNPYKLTNGDIFDIPATLNNIIRYYRSHSCYKIENNCLKIFDPALKAWKEHYISFITPDTLIFSDKKKTKQEYYVRKKKDGIDKEPLFDEILVYYPETSFLSRSYYSFSRSGQMVAYGNYIDPENCVFAAINEEDYIRLEDYFRKANIQKYLSNRSMGTFSLENPEIMFIRGNEMYSFNNDFDLLDASDYKAFYTAYFTALFYSKNLHFLPKSNYTIDRLLYDFDDIRLWGLYFGEKEIELTELEYYYLVKLVSAAPTTDKSFTSTYAFRDKNTKEAKIKTDGRYFTFRTSAWLPPEGERTVDIGFNFIEENHLDK